MPQVDVEVGVDAVLRFQHLSSRCEHGLEFGVVNAEVGVEVSSEQCHASVDFLKLEVLVSHVLDVEGGVCLGGRGVRVEAVSFGGHVAGELDLLSVGHIVAQPEVVEVGHEVVVLALHPDFSVDIDFRVAQRAVGLGVNSLAVISGVGREVDGLGQLDVGRHHGSEESGVWYFGRELRVDGGAVSAQAAGFHLAFHVQDSVHVCLEVVHLQALHVAVGVHLGFEAFVREVVCDVRPYVLECHRQVVAADVSVHLDAELPGLPARCRRVEGVVVHRHVEAEGGVGGLHEEVVELHPFAVHGEVAPRVFERESAAFFAREVRDVHVHGSVASVFHGFDVGVHPFHGDVRGIEALRRCFSVGVVAHVGSGECDVAEGESLVVKVDFAVEHALGNIGVDSHSVAGLEMHFRVRHPYVVERIGGLVEREIGVERHLTALHVHGHAVALP